MPSTGFQLILDAALVDYNNQVEIDLPTYPLTDSLRSCGSPDDVLKLLEDEARQFKYFRDGNRELLKWLSPVVHVVHTLSAVLGASITVVSSNILVLSINLILFQVPFKPANAIFAGVSVLIAVRISVHSRTHRPVILGSYRWPVMSALATMRSSACLNVLEISSNAFGSTMMFLRLLQ